MQGHARLAWSASSLHLKPHCSPRSIVVSRCGHLFCVGLLRPVSFASDAAQWEELSAWLQTSQTCPVCKGAIRKGVTDDVIPIYGAGREEQDPFKAVAERPKPERREPRRPFFRWGPPMGVAPAVQGGARVTFSAGIMPFPGGRLRL
jgi:hypothetical protein